MKAAVFRGPENVVVEERPIPKIVDPTDVIVKVSETAICGSDLHVYRGHQVLKEGVIMGHEFAGTITEVGSDVQKFKVGDKIVSPFTLSCLDCFYCKKGFTSRCEKGLLYGSAFMDGTQAEYVRTPLADGTLYHKPEGIPEKALLLLADIAPTGFFAAKNVLEGVPDDELKESVTVVLGCGPVGLCALVAVRHYHKGLGKVFAIDSVPSRLDQAKRLGAIPLNLNEDPKKAILEASNGRGADRVLEVVGHSDALMLAFDIMRPWGQISSVGVHNAEIPFSGNQAYTKNLRIQFGRCPVRELFPEAVELLKLYGKDLEILTDTTMPLSEAREAYKIFNKQGAQKIILKP